MHDPPHSCLCLGLASGNERWSSVKLLVRSCRHQYVCEILSKYSYQLFWVTVIFLLSHFTAIFVNCHIFASALLRSMKSGTWQLLWLDLADVNGYTIFFLSKYQYGWRSTAISVFPHLCFGVASGNESDVEQVNWQDLDGINLCANYYQSIPNCFH